MDCYKLSPYNWDRVMYHDDEETSRFDFDFASAGLDD